MKRHTIRKPLQILGMVILMLGLLTAANPALRQDLPEWTQQRRRDLPFDSAPGLGEYHLNGYGNWKREHADPKILVRIHSGLWYALPLDRQRDRRRKLPHGRQPSLEGLIRDESGSEEQNAG